MRETSNQRSVWLVGVMAALGLASMFVVIAVLLRSMTFRVSAALVVPSERAGICEELLAAGPMRVDHEQTLVTPAATVFQVWRDVAEPLRAQTELDSLAAQIIERIASNPQSKPAVDPEMQAIETRLHEMDKQLAAQTASQPADAGVDLQKLTEAWQQRINARQTLVNQLRQLDGRLAAKSPDEANVAVDPAIMAATQAHDQKLQADMQALKDREARFSRLLNDLLQAGEPLLERFTATVITVDKLVAEHAEEEKTADLVTSLAALRKHLSDWQKATMALSQVWLKQHGLLAVPEGDPVAVQTALEPAAKTFMQDTAAAKTSLNKTLELIGEGSDQPTKRLVLRNALSQELEESVEACRSLTEAARSVILLENRDLSAIADSVVGLRTKCRQQQDQIVVALRHEAYTKLHSQYQTEMTAAQTDRAKLLARADEAETSLLQTARELLSAVQVDRDHRGRLVQVRDFQQQRADLLAKWLALSNRRQRVPIAVIPVFTPAKVAPNLPKQDELIRAFALGASPLAAGMLLWILIGLPAAVKRSRQARAEYAEILQTASSKKNIGE